MYVFAIYTFTIFESWPHQPDTYQFSDLSYVLSLFTPIHWDYLPPCPQQPLSRKYVFLQIAGMYHFSL